jgi:serine/threonine-protein kinase
LKVIRSEFASDEEYRRMLVDEATAAAAIHHPNVCEVFELGSHRSALFIAMEWVAGDSLSGVLKQCNPKGLPLPLAARIIANAASGLHAAHEATGPDGLPLGIVHRDVSPQNILLSVSGQVKVSDFGIAKARDQLHAKTRTGNIKGKFAYIPPEQVKGAPVDRRADVYALGAVLYVTATGARPFGSGAQSALSKIIRGDFPKPSELVPGFDAAFEQVILKAMAHNPELRYQTADEFRGGLERWLAQRGEVVTETDIARAVKARLSPPAAARLRALRIGPEALQRLARESMTGSLSGESTPSHATTGPSDARRPLPPLTRHSVKPPVPSIPPLVDEVPTRRPPAQGPATEQKPRWYERFAPKRS